MDLSRVENNVGYTFKDKELLKKALTLSSFDGHFNNQSLECLGDAVLSFVVAEKFYLAGESEGQITHMKRVLVSDDALTHVSVKLGLDVALIRGKGDDNNKKAIPSAYEALTAAVYLDGGMTAAKQFVLATLNFDEAEASFDYISALQELLQSRGQKPPTYTKKECGTPQKPKFVASVEVYGKVYKGEGDSFSHARKLAAQSAYMDIAGDEKK